MIHNVMKYLSILFLLLFTSSAYAFGTCNSSYYFSIPTGTRAAFEATTATTIRFVQSNGKNGRDAPPPIIYGDKIIVNLNTCHIAFSASSIDGANAEFWLAQNFELWFDPDTIDCRKEYNFTIDYVWPVTSLIPVDTVYVMFSVNEIIN